MLAAGHPVMPWLTQHCAELLTKYVVGDDKKTAYERLKGKPFNGKLVPFGEYVHFKVAVKNSEAVGKLDPRWRDGVWLGVRRDSGEVYVGTGSGVVLTRSVRRREPSQRWNRQALGGVRGAPVDKSSLAYRPPRPAAPVPAMHVPWARPDAPRAAERNGSGSVRKTWGNTPQPRSKAWERRDGRLRRRSDVTGQCEQGAKVRRVGAAEGPERRHVREFESDAPEQSRRSAVETGDAASREEPMDETVSGDGPTAMDVSAVAEA